MSTQAVARVNPTIAQIVQEPQSWATLKDIASVMFAGGGGLGVLPGCFKNTQQVQAGMLVLMGMGEDPISGLQAVHPLPGNKIGFDYKFLMGVVERNAPQWRWHAEEEDENHVKGWFQASPDHPKYQLTYTIEQAKKAKLVKGGSAWETHQAEMVFKSWWLIGARRTAPAALRGVPIQYDVEIPEDGEAPAVPARETLGEKVDNAFAGAPAREPSEAVVVNSEGAAAPGGAAVTAGGAAGAAPVAAPTDSSLDINWQERFVELAKKAALLANCKTKAQRSEKIRFLLCELLAENGVKPNITSPEQVPMADWRLSFERLSQRYDADTGKYIGHADEENEGAGTGGGTTPPPAAKTAEPAPTEEDAPPDAEGAPDPGQNEDEDARIAQLSDPEYLISISRSLEQAYKQPETVLKESPKGSGKMWFVNIPILLACGMYRDGNPNMAQSKALFASTKPEYNLEPREVMALSLQVHEALEKEQAKRK